MKEVKKVILVVLAALFLHAAPSRAQCNLANLVDNRILVRVLPAQSLQDFMAAVEVDYPGLSIADTPLDQVPGRPIFLLHVDYPPGWTDADKILFSNAIEVNYLTYLQYGEALYTDETPEGATGSTLVDAIDDPALFDNQYARQKLNLDAAWPVSTGAGVTVAVLDTGVDASHPQIMPQIAPGGFNFVDGNMNTDDAGTGMDDDGDGLVDESVGHGTFVAGLITLVAPDAKILPIRVVNGEGRGDLWTLARGLFYAIDHGVEVINVSISSTYGSSAVEDAVEEAENLGIAVVAAAGNCGHEKPREFPAMESAAFGVAALDHNDVKADFSNFNDRLFISAPGDSTPDGNPDPTQSIVSLQKGGGFVYWQGTSMASPFVAGTIALVRAQHPEWPADLSTALNLRTIVAGTADNIDAQNPGYTDGQLGAGRVNAGAAVSSGPAAPSLGDLNASGAVDVFDLFLLLDDWSMVHSSADLNGDGVVNVFDLFVLLSNWG